MTLCYSDVETREALRRLKEVAMTFGCGDKNNVFEVSDVKLIQQFVTFLRERESKRVKWQGQSPQVRYRRTLVDFVMRISAFQKLTSETTYQAIYLLDRFMDQHDITESQLMAIALICLCLSGKLLESDIRIPKYRKLVEHLNDPVKAGSKVRGFAELEQYVLQAFDFDILVPTEVNFLEVFLLYVVDGRHAVLEDPNNNNNDFSLPNANFGGELNIQGIKATLAPSQSVQGLGTLIAMNETAFLILQEITRLAPVNKFSPSIVAAAIVLASRREHDLNFWTPTLQKITSYSLEQVVGCLKEYIEPRITKLGFDKPFNPPYFLNTTFSPYLIVEEDEVMME